MGTWVSLCLLEVVSSIFLNPTWLWRIASSRPDSTRIDLSVTPHSATRAMAGGSGRVLVSAKVAMLSPSHLWWEAGHFSISLFASHFAFRLTLELHSPSPPKQL